jgi:hypothetical protein
MATKKPTATKISPKNPETPVQVLKEGTCPTSSGKSTLSYNIGIDDTGVIQLRVTSDRAAGVYRFERLNLPARENNGIPDVDDLVDELLEDFVIDRLDHPALQRLLAPDAPAAPTAYAVSTALDVEDDIDEVY